MVNPQQHQGWLWVMVTPLVSYFHVWLSRSQATAQSLGQGLRNSHQCYALQLASGLNAKSVGRISSAISPCRTSRGIGRVGRALLEQEKHLFALWYQVRDGTLSRRDLSGAVAPIRSRVHELLIAAATEIGTREKTPWAKRCELVGNCSR